MNKRPDRELLKESAFLLLRAFGAEDNSGLERTPERFADIFLQDLEEDPKELLERSIIKGEGYSGMVVENYISFVSLCEHHLLPFYGLGTIAYIPDKKIVGLSKLPRLLKRIATGPNLQERITEKVAEVMLEVLKPKAVGVVLTATHLCVKARGVRLEKAETTTSVVKGLFLKKGATARAEFLSLIKNGRSGHE